MKIFLDLKHVSLSVNWIFNFNHFLIVFNWIYFYRAFWVKVKYRNAVKVKHYLFVFSNNFAITERQRKKLDFECCMGRKIYICFSLLYFALSVPILNNNFQSRALEFHQFLKIKTLFIRNYFLNFRKFL